MPSADGGRIRSLHAPLHGPRQPRKRETARRGWESNGGLLRPGAKFSFNGIESASGGSYPMLPVTSLGGSIAPLPPEVQQELDALKEKERNLLVQQALFERLTQLENLARIAGAKPDPLRAKRLAHLRDALINLSSRTGILIQTFERLDERKVWPPPRDLRYRPPRDDGRSSQPRVFNLPVPRQALPNMHPWVRRVLSSHAAQRSRQKRFWTSYDMYHQSERPWRQAIADALASLDRAAVHIDDPNGPAPDQVSVKIRGVLHCLAGLTPPAMVYGTAPPMDVYGRARAVELHAELGKWVHAVATWAPGATSTEDDTTAALEPRTSAVGNDGSPQGAPESIDSYSFARLNDTWQIRFQSEAGSFRDLVGLRRIHLLLEKQGKEVQVENLIGKPDLSRGDRIHDRRSIKDLEETEARLLALVEDVGANPLEVEVAREDLQEVQAELRSARGPTGKGRRTGDQAKAAADAVGRSMDRAIIVVSKAMPKFAEHLRWSMVQPNSMSPAYRPPEPVTWIL